MMRSSLWTIGIPILVALGAATAHDEIDAGAPQPRPAGVSYTITGTLVSASAVSLRIRTSDGARMSLLMNGETVLPASMGSGDEVIVNFSPLEGGAYLATKITVDLAQEPADARVRRARRTQDASYSALTTEPLLTLIGMICAGLLAGLSSRLVRNSDQARQHVVSVPGGSARRGSDRSSGGTNTDTRSVGVVRTVVAKRQSDEKTVNARVHADDSLERAANSPGR